MSEDRIPDARDGLTRLDRVLLWQLGEARAELGRESVPTVLLYGRVVEHISVSPAEFQAALARLGARDRAVSEVSMREAENVLEFWFGELDGHGRASGEMSRRWFSKDDEFDDEIRRRFGALYGELASGDREAWLASPRGRLAYIIVLDQFSRNLFRGLPEAFAHDGRARDVATEGIERGEDLGHAAAERMFLYMPLMHSEDLADQKRCVELFASWHEQAPPELDAMIGYSLDFARRHRDIVARFGRFPHRNAVLGRSSTPEETAFLALPGSSF